VKILGIVCSPRIGGNTEILVKEALEEACASGAETELVLLAEKKVTPCDGCETCIETGICRIKDDMQTIYQQLEQADGIILGTPVYFGNVSGQAKIFIDRTQALTRNGKLRNKVAGAIVAARRVGAGQVLSLLYYYFAGRRMVIAGGAIGYGREKGEVRQGVGGSLSLSALEEARALGRSVVRMLRQITEEKR